MKIEVKVKTKAKKEYVKEVRENEFEVAVLDAPEKGKANKAVVEALADHFNIPQINVEIVGGRTSRYKVVEINN